MTRVTGVRTVVAPCCGSHYATPRYASMNFSAREYWTDGWRELSLMPNDSGLRRCRCKRLLLLSDLVGISSSKHSDLPAIDCVPDEDLWSCIRQAQNEGVELAARMQLWWCLNHPYRKLYREHRDREEAAAQAAWQAASPDRRSLWDRLLRREPPRYSRQPGQSITYPPFEPSPPQLENLSRLSAILIARKVAGDKGGPLSELDLELAELFREQGRFEEAEAALADANQDGQVVKLVADLIQERLTAPARYML